MAQQGFYPDPPARRMAYDDDGSVVLLITANVPAQRSTGQNRTMNSESWTTTISGIVQVSRSLCIIFPELRDVTHSFKNLNTDSFAATSWTTNWLVSSDTTNGIDGNWVASNSYTELLETTSPNYRTHIGIVGSSGSKGIKFSMPTSGGFSNYAFSQWHLYGNKTAGQTPHRIDFCDAVGDELILDFDYGDQPRNSDRIWSPAETWNQSSAVYLKNRSTTKLAQDITVTREALTSDISDFLLLSKDNVTYGTTVSFTSINPQQIVGPIYVKHSPSISSTLSVKVIRLKVAVGLWL